MTETINIKKGTVIFCQDVFEEWMYDIRDGKVGIYNDYGLESEKLLVTLGEDTFIGEMGLIEKKPRSATAVALQDCTLIKITAESFSDYLRERPGKVLTIMQHTSSRIRELTADYVSASAAIAEYVKNQELGEPQSEELLKRMRKIADDSKNH